MIIVEGADNVGKSTLVKQLLEEDDRLHLLKRERFRVDRGETIGWSYFNMLVPPDGNYMRHAFGVADRLLASECIYGRLFRNGCRMTGREHEMIRSLLRGYGTIVVHCDAPDAVISRSWLDREQLYAIDPIPIAEAYRERLQTIFNPIDVIRYDWTAEDADATRNHIINRHRIQLYQAELEFDTITHARGCNV